LRLISDLPHGQLDMGNLPQVMQEEEIPSLEPAAVAISL